MSQDDETAEWLGEIVRYHGQLWDVTSVQRNDGDGRVWLWLVDHYGSESRTSADASDVEVALQ